MRQAGNHVACSAFCLDNELSTNFLRDNKLVAWSAILAQADLPPAT